MNYQPIFIKGEEHGDFQRACAPRYEAIKDYLDKNYQRPFSVFDLGANYGYFGLRLAFERDAVSVLVDTKPLDSVLERNAPSRTMWLNRHLGAEELQGLARSESFDVVLALNVVHHIPDWKSAVEALLQLGETVIFELPGKNDVGTANFPICDALREYVLSKPHELLFEMASHVSGSLRPIIAIQGENTITQQAIDAELRNCAPVGIKVLSDSRGKIIKIEHKRTSESRNFIHGMNLWNFHLLGGAWPKNIKQLVIEAVKDMGRFHDDLRPWNFILDGLKAHPIDYRDKLWRKTPETGGMEKCLSLLSLDLDYSDPEFKGLLKTV